MLENPAEQARLVHERMHWQDEAERLNAIVHAQRERIRQLEAAHDRQLLLKIRTFLQLLEPHVISARLRAMAQLYEKQLGSVLNV